MINELLVGISKKLDTLYSSYRIYTENVPQGLNPPSFFIQLLQAGTGQVVGNRYKRLHSFDIHFIPTQNGTELAQCQAVADILMDAMEYITVTNKTASLIFRGTKISTEIVDGVLHFFVQYNLFTRKTVTPDVFMDELTQAGFVKG